MFVSVFGHLSGHLNLCIVFAVFPLIVQTARYTTKYRMRKLFPIQKREEHRAEHSILFSMGDNCAMHVYGVGECFQHDCATKHLNPLKLGVRYKSERPFSWNKPEGSTRKNMPNYFVVGERGAEFN